MVSWELAHEALVVQTPQVQEALMSRAQAVSATQA
jgi:hypothetical protein